MADAASGRGERGGVAADEARGHGVVAEVGSVDVAARDGRGGCLCRCGRTGRPLGMLLQMRLQGGRVGG